MSYREKEPILPVGFMLFIFVIFCVFFIMLTGCASFIPSSLKDPIDIKSNASKDVYHYKSDMVLTLEGKSFPGLAATKLNGPLTFQASSKVDFDYVIIDSCHRDDLIRLKGKTITYTFNPLPVESDCKSILLIQAFSKDLATDWGLIAFKSDETLPTAKNGVECNGVRWTFSGYTVCNHKMLKPQRIAFDVDIKSFRAQPQCNIKKLSERAFELRPDLGECSAVFSDGERWHTALFIGYEREFIR